MRSVVLAIAVMLGCSKENKTVATDAAAPVSQADLSADAATASITINGKTFAVASVAAIQSLRFKEKDPKKAPNIIVTIEDPRRNTLSFDIPWNDGATGDIADARVSYINSKDVSYTTPQPTHINVTRVDAGEAVHLYDANFGVSVQIPGKEDTLAIRGPFNRLRVKESLNHLRRL